LRWTHLIRSLLASNWPAEFRLFELRFWVWMTISEPGFLVSSTRFLFPFRALNEQTLQRGAQHHQIHSARDVNIAFGELDLHRPKGDGEAASTTFTASTRRSSVIVTGRSFFAATLQTDGHPSHYIIGQRRVCESPHD
jgi:hypothetical protein